ncbi:hypothetical protein [Lentibacillus salinarum]|uniref:Lipoprotein n=1 Tax=Lentibacillus salinarum TaxID=446820 RepID=A0ABW3ZU14_9BACI
MKQILFSLVFLLVVLSACNNKEMETNYYLSLSGESDHWKLNSYEIVITPEGSKAGNGTLTMKNEDEHMADFFSFDTYAVVDGEKNRFHGRSISGQTDIAEQIIGTIEGEEEALTELSEVNEIYVVVNWNDDDADGDKEEVLVLYNKDKNGKTFLN